MRASPLPRDRRLEETRSPNCPNDISREGDDTRALAAASGAGKCGGCAWGFFRFDAEGHQRGESIQDLELTRLATTDGRSAGYRSQCGSVELYQDQAGRIGAIRSIEGERRFFPGIKDNWAFERFTRTTTLIPAA